MEKGWEQVFETTQEYQASIARDLLEEAGIKVVVINQHDSVYRTFGEFLVYVPENETERALEIIKELKD